MVEVVVPAPAPLPVDQRPVSREVADDGDRPVLSRDLAACAGIGAPGDSQAMWRNMKVVLRLAARLCRNRMLDEPRSGHEKALGLETRFLALARAYWHRNVHVLRLLHQQ